ncbi:hypothetical protein F2Q70_00020295 [Brassica cretica]|uniref:Uncharacterized protein n=1 Tax=Brassica cretica TaxID=69181 RepID=A0A8S9GUH8_BRACR|nr:hypothetical protein F2Q70_00020295 [Brassica cretica]
MVGSLSLFPSHCKKQKQLKNLLSCREQLVVASRDLVSKDTRRIRLFSSPVAEIFIDRHKSDHMSSENYIRLSTIRTWC